MLPRLAIRISLATAFFAAISLGLLAQDAAPPDLSGTWVLNPAKSKVPKNIGLDPETLVIKCAGSNIDVTTSSGGRQTLQTFVADGKEHPRRTSFGGQVFVKAQWKKSVLFTQMGTRVIGPGIGTRDILTEQQHWTLSPDGLALTRELQDPKEILVYDKKR